MAQLLTATDQERLEQELVLQDEPLQRLAIIDKLAGRYVFTQTERALSLLQEQEELLRQHPHPDFLLSFNLLKALAENQVYRYAQAQQYFEHAMQLVKERGDVRQQAEVCIDFAGTLMNLHDMERANQLLERAGKLLRAYPDRRLQARITCREGFMMLHYANYGKAAELLLQAEKAITLLGHELELKDFYFLTLIYSGLGKVYALNEEPQKSVRAYERVVHMCESMGIRARLSWHYLNAGNGFLALNDLERAEEFFQRVIDNDDDQSPQTRAAALANLGFCHMERKDYEQALQLFDRAEDLYLRLEPDDDINLSVIEHWRGRLFADLQDHAKALEHYTEAFKYAHLHDDVRQLGAVSRDISTYYAECGDYKNAYEYLILHSQYEERHMEEVNKRLQMELEIKYEAEKRKQETELLQLQSTKLQLKALRAQMNPHFLYNALNAIQSFITSNEVASAAKYLARFAKLMRQSLEYSDLEIISLEKEVEFLDDYLTINQHLRFRDRLTFSIEVDEELEDDIIGVPTMIVQPYVENALEHGLRNKKEGVVTVRFSTQSEDSLLCVVEDNGIGRQKAREFQLGDAKYRSHQSRGTRITEERLRILHQAGKGRVFVKTHDLLEEESGGPAGTRVEITVPIMELGMR